MKRSGFLKSLMGIIAAPSILGNIDVKEAPIIKNESIVPPVKHLDERVRRGDIVIFKNGQHAMVTSIVMGEPKFRSLNNEPLTDTSSYGIMGSMCQS